MLATLREAFKNTPNIFPTAKYKNYLENPKTTSQTYVDFVKASNYDSIKQKYAFPEEIMKQLKRMLYSSEYGNEKINYLQRLDLAYLERVFGVAKKSNDKVVFAVLKTQTRANLVSRYNIVRRKKCTNILFIESCKWVNDKVKRGFTESETNTINEGIILHSEVTMKNELNKVGSTYQTVLTQGSFLFSQSGYTVLALNRYGRISIHGLQKNFDWSSGYNYTYKEFGNKDKTNDEPYTLIITDNGNMILNDKYGRKKWESNSAGKGKPPYYSNLKDDGVFYLYSENDIPVWHS